VLAAALQVVAGSERLGLKTTRYFEEQVLRKRPYIKREWCRDVLAARVRREVQTDGRVRYWGKILIAGEVRPRFRRVVTLDDGATVHNAFFDRNFRQEAP
jgi:hypothetical protein